MFVACSSIHGGGWLGLVHQPLVREIASLESRRTGLKKQGCVPGRVGNCKCPSAIRRYSPHPEFFLTVEEGGRHTLGEGAKGGRGVACDFSRGLLVTSHFESLMTSRILWSRNAELSFFLPL